MKKKLIDIVGAENVLENENLSNHSSFRIGGKANFVIFPTTIFQIEELYNFFIEECVNYKIVGAGTNLLFADCGFDGVIVSTRRLEKKLVLKGQFLKVSSGVMLAEVSSFCMENGLSGFEFASLIPGTIGGATFMNAGAFGGQMSDIVFSVTYIYNGIKYTKKNNELRFEYRHSLFGELKNAVILEVVFKLKQAEKLYIYNKVLDNSYKRSLSQPVGFCAGSVFKKVGDVSAGKIIDECGLKGFSVGDAFVSEKHANFIMNKGNASYADVIELINYVKNVVKKIKNIDLELELEIVK